MNASITVDTTGFEAVVRGIQNGVSTFRQMPSTEAVLKVLTRRVLEACIRHTRMASASAIKALYKAKGNSAKAPGIAMSVNSGVRGGTEGRVWYGEKPDVSTTVTPRQREALRRRAARRPGGMVWVPMDETRNPGAGMLARFQELDRFRESENKGPLRKKLQAALGARGLARNSWLQIAHSLGIALLNVAGGSQVGAAKPSSGAWYTPGKGEKVQASTGLYFQIWNTYPFTKFKIPGAAILSRAIQGEVGYFRNNFKHGVFRDIGTIASRYKGIIVS